MESRRQQHGCNEQLISNRCLFRAKHLYAHAFTVWINIWLFSGDACGVDQRVREHTLDDFIAERFLKVNMSCRDNIRDGLTHKVVIDNFAELVFVGRVALQGHVQIDIDDDTLLPLLFEIMHTDIHVDLKGL